MALKVLGIINSKLSKSTLYLYKLFYQGNFKKLMQQQNTINNKKKYHTKVFPREVRVFVNLNNSYGSFHKRAFPHFLRRFLSNVSFLRKSVPTLNYFLYPKQYVFLMKSLSLLRAFSKIYENFVDQKKLIFVLAKYQLKHLAYMGRNLQTTYKLPGKGKSGSTISI